MMMMMMSLKVMTISKFMFTKKTNVYLEEMPSKGTQIYMMAKVGDSKDHLSSYDGCQILVYNKSNVCLEEMSSKEK